MSKLAHVTLCHVARYWLIATVTREGSVFSNICVILLSFSVREADSLCLYEAKIWEGFVKM